MDVAKKLFDKAAAEGKTRKPYLQLGEKLEGGGVRSTGKHIVKLVSGKLGKGTDPINNQSRDEFQMVVEENKMEKQWNVPVKDKEGNLHYLIAKLAEIPEGSLIALEMKKRGMKNYIDLQLADEKGEEIPTIQVDEDSEGTGGEVESGEDIPPEDIPF